MADRKSASTNAPGMFLDPADVETKIIRSTLRAEAPEFKPRASSSKCNASEFNPSSDLALVSRELTEPATLAQSMSSISPMSPFQPYGADLQISQAQYPQKIDLGSLSLSKAVPATEFLLFPKLPAELRFKIWILSLPCLRTVELHYNALNSHTMSSTPAPAAFYTSRESRREALKQYSLLFEDYVLNSSAYIDVRTDTLYLCDILTEEFAFTLGSCWSEYVNYFRSMFKTIRPSILEALVHLAISKATYDTLDYDD
ncbi:hypothetical protein BKA65DRAFT_533972 [Rhexocercosporidium sp. MPI-PUGE-AT-0058]|nr:hypothetical protein BKA65DRAFT_533972 [Rhexocercosporidium sp. MPI-PUGE-AT-0058]